MIKLPTINESCNKLNISKMTLYKYLHNIIINNPKLKSKTYINTKHKRVIENDLYKKLEKAIKGKHQRRKPNSKVYINKLTILRHDNKILKESLKRQQIQISQQNKQLNHQQILQLNSQKELNTIRKELDSTKNSLLTYKNKKSHGFIWKLFH